MSNVIRHKGVIKSSGSRCIVVYRELPDEPNYALVCYADSIPSVYSSGFSRVVDGVGQSSPDLSEVLSRE